MLTCDLQIAGPFMCCEICERVTSVESKEAFVTQHLLRTVEAVLVHQLSYKGACGALVLHARLHQVDGVHSRGTSGYKTHIFFTDSSLYSVFLQ